MAGGAFRPQRALVGIVLAMTGHAIYRSTLEALIGMAGFALCVGMGAE